MEKFLKSLVPDGEIELNDLQKCFTLDTLPKDKDIYFLGGVRDPTKRNKDEDIIAKNYCCMDFDIRENRKKKFNGEIVPDESMALTQDYIQQVLDASEFNCRRYIVFSGNGYHVYFTAKDYPLDPEEYKEFVGSLYARIDKLFNDDVFKIDPACKNIGRILRLPGTINFKRQSKHGLEPAECKIMAQQNKDAPIKEWLQSRRESRLREEVNLEIKSKMKMVNDPQLDMILQIPIEELVERYCNLQLQKDKKNFKSPKDGKNVGMFLQNNILYVTGTHYVSDKFKGYNTFLFAKEHFKLGTNKATFDRFREEYPGIVNQKPKVKKLELADEIKIDFDHKLPFTRGLKALDTKFGRCDVNRFNVIIGESLSGKTERTFFVARENARETKVLYISLEMTPHNLLVRYAMKRAGVTQIQRSDKSMAQSQKDGMQDYIRNIQKITNLKIIGLENPSIFDIIKTIEEYYLQGFTLFYVDNMGFIRGDGEEIVETKEISRQLKMITNKLPITVNLVHHFRKGTQKERKSARGLADIRSSGKIENDADNVIQVWRNLSEDEKTDEERAEVKIYLHKDRDFGQPAVVRIWFDKGLYVDRNPYSNLPF